MQNRICIWKLKNKFYCHCINGSVYGAKKRRSLRTVPTIVTAHAKVVARDAKEMRTTRTGFVSCKSGRLELFLVEKMRRFSTDEK